MTRKRLIKNCNNTKEVVEVLARMIRKDNRYSDCEITASGTFGLCCASYLFVKRNGEIIGDLEVIDGGINSKFSRRSFEQVGNYEVGSIGWLNGMNYKTYDLPLDNQKCFNLVFSETER